VPRFNYENLVKSMFFEVINSSATSMFSIIYRCLYITVFACRNQVKKHAYRISRTCSIGFIFSYKIIVMVMYSDVF